MPASRSRVLIATFALTCAWGVTAAAQDTFRLRGRVLSQNGVLAGATVTLVPLTPLDATARIQLGAEAPQPHDRQITDADGVVRLEVPRDGFWELRLAAEGRRGMCLPFGVWRRPGGLDPVVLEATRDVRIVVHDGSGQPLAGARVWPGEPAGEGGWQPLLRAAITDASGTATLAVTAEASSVTVLHPEAALLPSVPLSSAGGPSLAVTAARSVPNVVRVRDEAGRPLRDIVAAVGRPDRPFATSDEEGRMLVPTATGTEVPPLVLLGPRGVQQVEWPSGGTAHTITYAPVPLVVRLVDDRGRPVAGGSAWSDAEPVRVATADEGGVLAIVSARTEGESIVAAATGHVTVMRPMVEMSSATGAGGPAIELARHGALGGTVVTSEGTAIADAKVMAIGSAARVPWRADAGVRFTRTDTEGAFALTGVAPGEPIFLRVLHGDSAPHLETLVPLRPAEVRDGLRIEVDRGRRLHGRVVDADDQPIEEASVTLFARATMPDGSEGSRLSLHATTDATGSFSWWSTFGGLADLRADADGFAPMEVRGLEVAGAASAFDLGTLVLLPAGGIVGRVADRDGQPVDGASVVARPAQNVSTLRFDDRLPASLASSTSDDAGRFHLDGLGAAEPVELEVRAEGFATARLSGVEPSTQTVDVTLEPSPRVPVRVVDGEGVPVVGARVVALEERVVPLFGGGSRTRSRLLAEATTDADGLVILAQLEPVRATFVATRDEFLLTRSAPVQLEVGVIRDEIELVLRPGAVIEGTVRLPDGAPAVGAMVVIVPSAGAESVGRLARGQADEEGRYRLAQVPPGRHRLAAWTDAYPSTEVEVEVALGAPQSVDIALEGGVGVHGRLVDDVGAPIATADLALVRAGSWLRPPFATTDEQGGFRFVHVRDGTYTVRLRGTAHALREDTAIVHVEGDPVFDHQLVALRGAAVSGSVSGLDYDALTRVEIHAVDGRRRLQGQLRFDGRYRLEGLGPGRWRVIARLPTDGRVAEGELEAEPGGDHVLDLAFRDEGLRLAGQILLDGTPLSGVTLLLRRRDVRAAGVSAVSGGDGRYRFEALEAGRYYLELADRRRPGLRFGREVEVFENRWLPIELERHVVEGLVVSRGDGGALPGARLSATPLFAWDGLDEMLEVRETANGDGRFALGPLTAGRWRIVASHPEHDRVHVDVEVGVVVGALVLELDPGRGLQLRVTGPGGRPPTQVHVAVTDQQRDVVVAGTYTTGADGVVRVDGVPPGPWLVWVAAVGTASGRTLARVPGESAPVALTLGGTIDLEVPELIRDDVAASAYLVSPSGEVHGHVAPGGFLRVAWSLRKGRVALEWIPPGEWSVVVRAADDRRFYGRVQVRAGHTVPVRLDPGPPPG